MVPGLSGFRTPLLFLGTFAPAFVALGLTARDQGIPGIEVLLFMLGNIALSVAMTWLYVRNPFALDTSLPVWLTTAFLWIMTGYFLDRMRNIEGIRTRDTASGMRSERSVSRLT
jgi:hypothetical protein